MHMKQVHAIKDRQTGGTAGQQGRSRSGEGVSVYEPAFVLSCPGWVVCVVLQCTLRVINGMCHRDHLGREGTQASSTHAVIERRL